jgi:hypothetical protein
VNFFFLGAILDDGGRVIDGLAPLIQQIFVLKRLESKANYLKQRALVCVIDDGFVWNACLSFTKRQSWNTIGTL